MFQLIRQTRGTPQPEWLRKTWELFTVIVTYFPSTQNSEQWIKSHFSQNISHMDPLIAQLAQFCYIRFSARCAIGKPLDGGDRSLIPFIPVQFQLGRQQFGASLYEQLWNQRLTHPKLPIPYALYEMTERMFEIGCDKVEGVFRLPGNLRVVGQMAVSANQGRNPYATATIHDLASLLKQWFRDLPDPVVCVDTVLALKAAYDDKSYFEFIQWLPKAHYQALMFLIGFLQRLAAAEPVTMMGPKNLAICFGPNIVRPRDNTNPDTIKQLAEVAIEFLTTLIQNWDCSEIYPMPPELIGK
jgi:hypothetical protein